MECSIFCKQQFTNQDAPNFCFDRQCCDVELPAICAGAQVNSISVDIFAVVMECTMENKQKRTFPTDLEPEHSFALRRFSTRREPTEHLQMRYVHPHRNAKAWHLQG